MSIDLVVEVLKHAPANLNPTERLTLVVIAESCRAEGRTTYYRDGWDADEVARRVGVTADSLTKVFRSLASKGLEVRVPHAVKDGKPIFAFKGKQTTFKLPRLTPQSLDESPPFEPGEDAKARTSVRQSPDERPGNRPQSPDESPPLLLKELPSKNTSSLSAQDRQGSASTTPRPTERENEGNFQYSKTTALSVPQQLIAKRGAVGDQIDFVRGWIESQFDIKGVGWWINADRNGTLAAHVADALKAEADDHAQPSDPCIRCDGYQREWNGDYFHTTDCLACHGSGVRTDSAGRRCPTHPSESIACGVCRGDRLASPSYMAQLDHQRRSSERGQVSRASRRSTSALRAEQALRVADELDRENGHGRYAKGQHIPHRDPPDINAYKTSRI